MQHPHPAVLEAPKLYEGHKGARLNLATLPIDGSRYWEWWLENYGDEAVTIARAFVADVAWASELQR